MPTTDRVAQVFNAASIIQSKERSRQLTAACAASLRVGAPSQPSDWLKSSGGFRLPLREGLWLFFDTRYDRRMLYAAHYHKPKRKRHSEVEYSDCLTTATDLANVLTRWGFAP